MTTPTPGCYIDSHHGHYAIPGVIRLAQDHGFCIDQFAQFTLDSYDEHYWNDNYPGETLIELSDEAIEWLNHNEGLTGHWWGWNEGDFGLYPIEDDD